MRYFGSTEACWRTFGFNTHVQIPDVTRLHVHLPNQQNLTFNADANLQQVVAANAGHHASMLTAWFALNRDDAAARDLLYTDVPSRYRWDAQHKRWVSRQRLTGGRLPISRMYHVRPNEGDRYYFRLLLLHVRGAQSFEDVRTYNGTVYATYKDTCEMRGLLENDSEWDRALHEAAAGGMPHAMRTLFALILSSCHPAHPETLWATHKAQLCDDCIQAQWHNREQPPPPLTPDMERTALLHIQRILEQEGLSLRDFPAMPIPEGTHAHTHTHRTLCVATLNMFRTRRYANT